MTVTRLSKCLSRGSSVELPAGDLFGDVFLLLLLDEPIADVFDVDLLPIELLGIRFEIRLYIGEQLGDVDLLGDELDLFGVAKAEFDARAAAGRLRQHAFELAPVADDLVELPLILLALGAGEFFDGDAQVFGGPVVLAAILEDLYELAEGGAGRILVLAGGLVGERGLVELDKVLIVGEVEAFDACCQAGDGFVFGEGVEGPGFGLCLLVVAGATEKRTGESGKRLDAELHIEQGSPFELFSDARSGFPGDHFFQGPAPALAVVFGRFPAGGDRIENGIAGVVDGRALRLAAVAPAVFVVGKFVELGQRLQSPEFVAA